MIKKLNQGKSVRIYGSGGHSQVIREVLEKNQYIVTKVFDDKPEGVHHASKNVEGGAREDLTNFPHAGDPIIIAVGINAERAEIAKFMKCTFERAIHKSAIISNTSTIGEGTVVFAGAIIQPNTVIGKHVIINTGASVDHDNIIGDYAHISPKAALCGHVEVGEGSHVGVGAVVIPKVKIGKWCTIGAGTIVLSDVPDFCTMVGNPGKIIKNPNCRDK
jgi:acetyltransferase EpsM